MIARRFLARQAHGLLNQDVLAMVNGGQGRIGVIFIAIQHQDRVEIALCGHLRIVGIAVCEQARYSVLPGR